MQKLLIISVFIFLVIGLAACAPAPEINISIDPSTLKFSGERAFKLEEAYNVPTQCLFKNLWWLRHL